MAVVAEPLTRWIGLGDPDALAMEPPVAAVAVQHEHALDGPFPTRTAHDLEGGGDGGGKEVRGSMRPWNLKVNLPKRLA